MAIVRTGRAAHQIRDIGPAAGSVDGLSAIGRVSAIEGTSAALLLDRAQALGSGPVERSHAEPTPRIASALPARQEETHVTVTTPPPATPHAGIAIPCTTCMHEPVCYLRREIPDDPNQLAEPMVLGPGLRLVTTGVRIECDHQLVSIDVPTPTDRRLAEAPEDLEARRKKVAGNLTQESRQRGANANRARAAGERATKDATAIQLLREHDGNAEAVGQAMGVSGTAVRGWVARMAAAGSLPDDVATLVAGRARKVRTL